MKKSDTSFPVIIVLGAARSGTFLLANTLRKNYRSLYIPEVNHVWKAFVPKLPHDAIPAAWATETVVDGLQRHFRDKLQASNEPILIEKTAANTLRPSFVHRVFPNAVFVHVVRDGRDVAVSARRKYLGDVQKVTKGGVVAAATAQKNAEPKIHPANSRFALLGREVIHKLKHAGSRGLRRDFARHLSTFLLSSGLRKQALWGPRFPGIREVYKSHSLLEVAALQWKHSVDAVASFAAVHPEARLVQVKYEDILRQPNAVFAGLFEEIGLSYGRRTCSPQHAVNSSGNTWHNVLNATEVQRVHEHIGTSLSLYGYYE